MTIKGVFRLSLGFGLCCTAAVSQAEDWPTFRGANRAAVSAETGLLDSWSESGPRLVWEAKGSGRGYASPAVADGKVFTLGDHLSTADDTDEYLTCFSASDGKQLWKTKTGPAYSEHNKESWNGSRSTPTVDGDLVYVISPFGKLVCAKVSDGSVAWEKNLKQDFGGKKKDSWGYGESPLVDGDLLLCTPGGEQATVIALDKKSGELVWKCSRPTDVGAGHSSIVISQVGGRKVYVQNTGGGPMGIAENGELLWTYDMAPPTAFIPTPIIKDDLVFSVAGYNLGGALLQQVPSRDGVNIKEVYGLKKEVANKHGGVIRVGDYLYGSNEDRNTVYCAELTSGEVKWRERGAGEGSTSVIAGDGKLFVRFQNGTVALAKLSPDAYEEISSFKTPGSGENNKPSWAHPVIANGQLLLREGDSILCYDISK
ncbi:MAG: PQQ-binding-like beta-propeller repeat protein [Pirellulaceae bacterium]